jgi:hypothetical protein
MARQRLNCQQLLVAKGPFLIRVAAAVMLSCSLSQIGPWSWLSSGLAAGLCFVTPRPQAWHGLVALACWFFSLMVPPQAPDIFMIDQVISESIQAYRYPHWTAPQWLAGQLGCLLGPWIWPKRFGQQVGTGLAVLGLLALLLWNAFFLQPALTQSATAEPDKYGYDGHMYLKLWYLEKGGLDHYTALAEAMKADSRPINTIPYYRSPLLFWMLMLVPKSSNALLFCYCLGALAACLAMAMASRAWGAGELAWLGPLLYVPQVLYCLLSSNTLFLELWGSWLVLLGCWAAARQRHGRAIFCFLLAACMREHYLLWLFFYALELPRFKRLAWGTWLAAWLACFAYYARHRILCAVTCSLVGVAARPGPPTSLAAILFTGFNFKAMLACLAYGWNLHQGGPWLWPLVAVLGYAGLWLCRHSPGVKVTACSVSCLTLAYCFFSHHQEYAPGEFVPDYFGLTLSPFLMLGSTLALSQVKLRLRPPGPTRSA